MIFIYNGPAEKYFMNNTIGLVIIGVGIALIVGFVVSVQYMANHHPETKLGEIAKKIDDFIDRLPED